MEAPMNPPALVQVQSDKQWSRVRVGIFVYCIIVITCLFTYVTTLVLFGNQTVRWYRNGDKFLPQQLPNWCTNFQVRVCEKEFTSTQEIEIVERTYYSDTTIGERIVLKETIDKTQNMRSIFDMYSSDGEWFDGKCAYFKANLNPDAVVEITPFKNVQLKCIDSQPGRVFQLVILSLFIISLVPLIMVLCINGAGAV
jgi:hypothetical protein